MMFAKNGPLLDKGERRNHQNEEDGLLASLHEKWFGAKADARLHDRQGDGDAEALTTRL